MTVLRAFASQIVAPAAVLQLPSRDKQYTLTGFFEALRDGLDGGHNDEEDSPFSFLLLSLFLLNTG